MGSLSKEKIEKIKILYDSKKEKDIKNNIIFNNEKNSNLKKDPIDDYYLIFKKLYKPNKQNYLNINYDLKDSIKENKTEIEIDIKNNLEDDMSEINYIMFRNHKSFDFGSNYWNEINVNNNNFKKINELESITFTTNENTNQIIESNSAKDKISVNSDYLDISQSILLLKEKPNIYHKKDIYGNETLLRKSYYYKLIVTKTWNPSKKVKKCNTLFFFDWDDTLLCTTYLIPILNSNINKENIKIIKKKLVNLDENVSNLLKHTLQRGMVFIITNASPGWVEYSSYSFLPLTAKILRDIKIISAKGLYSKNYPGDPRQWKIEAFKHVIESNNINKKLITNIISFGDSIIDLEAIEALKYIFCNAFIKIIKFKENPHPIQLEKQIFIINSQIDYIINKLKNVNLKILKKKVD